MRIGWRAYLKQKWRKASTHLSVGIAVGTDTVTFCALKKEKDQNALVITSEETVGYKDWGKHFTSWVERHHLTATPAYVAFSLDWYHFLQIDRPAVEDNEMQNALSYSVKDLIGTDEPLVFDYTDLAVPLAGNKKINVFAIAYNAVETVCRNLLDAGVDLKQISVAELAACELLAYSDEPVMVVVQEPGEEVSVNIIKDGHLYVSRRLKGFENLGSFSEEELQMGLTDSLSVQIQRSMDYFESQLRQAPVRKIRLRLDTTHTALVAQQINQVVSADVAAIDTQVTVAESLSVSRLNMTALGMALTPLRELQSSTDGDGKAA